MSTEAKKYTLKTKEDVERTLIMDLDEPVVISITELTDIAYNFNEEQ